MIVGVSGKVVYKEINLVHILTGGLTYELHISLQTYGDIISDEVSLYSVYVVREDAALLYGFSSTQEKQLFQRLIKISGVGPKVALAICSSFTASQFARVIADNSVNDLKKVPGIGPKSAGRILVELAGFDAVLSSNTTLESSSAKEASMALESLGFKKELITKTLSKCSANETAALVKEALKLLQK